MECLGEGFWIVSTYRGHDSPELAAWESQVLNRDGTTDGPTGRRCVRWEIDLTWPHHSLMQVPTRS